MYDFVDRPVAELDSGGRFLVWGMRRWVEAMAAQTCPPNAVGPAFAKWDMIEALPHFHMAMALLNRAGRENFLFNPLRCSLISEDEAMLLQLVQTIRDGGVDRTEATLEMMVVGDAVTPLLAALTAVAMRLDDAGLGLEIRATPARPRSR